MGDNLTRLLQGWRAGDAMARDRLLSDVYDTLRDMARMRWHRHGACHTLQPTAVVDEAMMRLLDHEIDWQDRAHFFAMAALKMRAVMVDHARAQLAEKRGGEVAMLTLSHAESAAGEDAFDVLALDLALQRLARGTRGRPRAWKWPISAAWNVTKSPVCWGSPPLPSIAI